MAIEKTPADKRSGVTDKRPQALLTIVAPTFLVEGVEAQPDFFDAWAFIE